MPKHDSVIFIPYPKTFYVVKETLSSSFLCEISLLNTVYGILTALGLFPHTEQQKMQYSVVLCSG